MSSDVECGQQLKVICVCEFLQFAVASKHALTKTKRKKKEFFRMCLKLREKGDDWTRGRERERAINDQVASLSLLPLELLNMDENFDQLPRKEKHQRFVEQ